MKCIYLDQNHWIKLTDAFFGRRHGLRYLPVLNAAQAAVASSAAAFPLSHIHIYETLKCPDVEQRKRLARVLIQLSRNIIKSGERDKLSTLRIAFGRRNKGAGYKVRDLIPRMEIEKAFYLPWYS